MIRLGVGLLGLILLFISCSKDDGSGGEETLDAPVLVSSIPEDGATDVTSGDISIVLTFDQNVTSPSSTHDLVSLGNATINNITANLKEVSIEASGLEEGATYELIIPQGVILGPTKVKAQEVRISFSTKEAVSLNITTTLVTENPMSQTQNVYDFLLENYNKKIISSVHSNVSWNTNEAEWVYYHTNKYPAMTTVDYIHLPASPANWIDYTQTDFIEEWWNNNGLFCANWHWIVPRYEGDEDINNYTYKPDETTFDAKNILVDGTWENEVAMADLEELAGYLKLLQDKNIPVIWRPLHEAAGNIYEYTGGKAWFWWGYEGAEVYKKLWIFMFNYFKSQGLKNLIWVWTTQTSDDAFYPGDEYVDIVGRDIYNNSDSEDIATQFETIQELYSNKMVTLSEMGTVSTISSQWTQGARWSWFMPWYDYTRTNVVNSTEFNKTTHEHAPVSWWQDAMDQDYVITRGMMPSLK